MENKYKRLHLGKHSSELPMRIMKFVVDNCEIISGGQGLITVGCNKLWDMKNEEFEKVFGVKIKEIIKEEQTYTKSRGKESESFSSM